MPEKLGRNSLNCQQLLMDCWILLKLGTCEIFTPFPFIHSFIPFHSISFIHSIHSFIHSVLCCVAGLCRISLLFVGSHPSQSFAALVSSGYFADDARSLSIWYHDTLCPSFSFH